MKALIKPFIFIVSALMVLSFASCNDFLDKEPEGKVRKRRWIIPISAICTNRYQACMQRFVPVVFALGDLGELLPFATGRIQWSVE